MKYLKLLATLALLVSINIFAQEISAEQAISNDIDKISYSLGFKTGEYYLKQEIKINPEQFNAGLLAGINNQTPTLSTQEINILLAKLQLEQISKNNSQQGTVAKENLAKGKEFLEKNKQHQDVMVLASGLQYKILASGKGDSPTIDDGVTVNYRGTLIDDTEFDSSYKRNESVTLQIKQLIKGWQEALLLMKPGDKWRLFVPPELAYGNKAAGTIIQSNSTLIFDIELLAVVSKNVQENPNGEN